MTLKASEGVDLSDFDIRIDPRFALRLVAALLRFWIERVGPMGSHLGQEILCRL